MIRGQIFSTRKILPRFLVQVKGLALKTYYIAAMRPEEGANTNLDVAKIRIHNSEQHPFQVFT